MKGVLPFDPNQLDFPSLQNEPTLDTELESLQKCHRSHFLTICAFSISSIVIFVYQSSQARSRLVSESANCAICYLFDLYTFVVLMAGSVLVALINIQTRVGQEGEPPIVLFDKRRTISLLLIGELIYIVTVFGFQGATCSLQSVEGTLNLVLIKVVAFLVQFLVGWNYLRVVRDKLSLPDPAAGDFSPQKKLENFTVTIGERETRSEMHLSEAPSESKARTLNLEESDTCSVSKFSNFNFDQIMAQSTVSLDDMHSKNLAAKVLKKRMNFMIK